jgi:hypothetical protein
MQSVVLCGFVLSQSPSLLTTAHGTSPSESFPIRKVLPGMRIMASDLLVETIAALNIRKPVFGTRGIVRAGSESFQRIARNFQVARFFILPFNRASL